MENIEKALTEIVEYLKTDEKLLRYVLMLVNNKKIMNNEEVKYMMLASTISADSLTDSKSCKASIEYFEFLSKNIDLLVEDEKSRYDLEKFIERGMLISKREYNNFIESEKENGTEEN